MGTLHDVALAAYHEREAAHAKAKRDRQADENAIHVNTLTTRMRVAFGADLEITPVYDTGTVEVEGVRFSVHEDELDGYSAVVMDGTCPRCGSPAQSYNIITAADLGALLVKFEPRGDHICMGVPLIKGDPASETYAPEPTAGEILLDAIREYIDARLAEHEAVV